MNNQTRSNPNSSPQEKTAVAKKVDQVQQKMSAATHEVQEQAAELSQQAKVEAKSSLQTQKEMAAQELHGVAAALRQTSNQLRQQDQTIFARYSHRAADQVEKASVYLEEHDLEELANEAEDFARRQPELFLGGAFTLGLLAARFMKSSAPSSSQRTNLPARPRPTALAHTTPGSQYPYATTSPLNQNRRTGTA